MNITKFTLGTAALGVAALVSTGCGGSDDESSAPQTFAVDSPDELKTVNGVQVKSFTIGDGEDEIPPGTYRVDTVKPDKGYGGMWMVCNIDPCAPDGFAQSFAKAQGTMNLGVVDEGSLHNGSTEYRDDIVVLAAPPTNLAVAITEGIRLIQVD